MQKEGNAKWQAVLLNQQLANAKKWIRQLEEATDITLLINNEYENILRAIESALRIPSAFKYAYKLIYILHPIVVDSGDWLRWQIYLTQLSENPRNQDPFQQGNIFIQLGDVKGKLGESADAEAFYNEGIFIFRELREHKNLAIAMGRLAVVYANKNELTKAQELCNEAFEIANSTNDLSTSSKISLNLSYIFHRSQDFQSSLKHSKFAYNNFRSLKMKRDATKALLNIVSLSSALGNWRDVEIQTQSLLDDLDQASDITIYSQLKNILGVAAFKQAKYSVAESAWHETLLLHSQINDLTEIAGIYNNLGMVYTKLNEWDTARKMLNKAIETYKELGDFYNIANAQDNLADFYIEREDFVKACNILQVSINELMDNIESPNSAQLISQMQAKLASLQEKRV